jgi:hypothetical protein
MNKSIIRFLLLVAGIAAYNYLFWQQKMGINLPIFNTLLMLGYFLLEPQSLRSRPAQVSALCTLLTGIPVVLFNTGISVFANCVSLITMVGFAHQPALRSIIFSLANAAITFLSAPVNYIEGLGLPMKRRNGQPVIWYTVRRSIVPLAVCIVFYVIYRNASIHFKEFSITAWDKLFGWLRWISFSHFLFLILGALIVTAALYRRELADIVKGEASLGDVLKRIRKKIKLNPYRPNTLSMGLRKEYRTAVSLLILVNLLLLTLNIIDIRFVWFGFELKDGFSLKQFVHEGTYLLILSILLSMAILMYFFRWNLNFFSQNRTLKTLSYIWLAQNFILCISVFLRNYHYIQFHGLAYKRIGVIFFLVLTAIGLFTLYRKIDDRKTSFYLWKVNTWAAYGLMVFAAFFNWSIFIAKYNLRHPNPSGIDSDFYLEMQPAVLPLLYENLPAVERQIQGHFSDKQRWTEIDSIGRFKEILDMKAALFVSRYERYEWPSWNLADQKTYEKLKKVKKMPAESVSGNRNAGREDLLPAIDSNPETIESETNTQP